MLVIYFFVGLIILLAVWFVSFTYNKRQSQQLSEKQNKSSSKDDVTYK